MIQDIAPHRFDNQYNKKRPIQESYLLCFSGKEVLVKNTAGKIDFPRLKDFPSEENIAEGCRYLFSIDGERFYLANNTPVLSGGTYNMENTELFRSAQPGYLAFAGVTGYQLYRWYESHRFCGNCGKPMEHHHKERMMFCPSCLQQEYPKISPAVIVGITDGNRLLMSKYAGREYKKYALIAGFTEIGETVEETVAREVMEEVGLKIKNLKYYKSQPWSFTDTLLFGFFAELEGEAEIVLDEEELALAEWFEREDIPECESSASLTNEMIMIFKYGRSI